MKPIIEEEKKKPETMLPGQYKHYPNKDGPLFFYPPKNYHPTPIPRPKDLDLSEEQWEQFDGEVREDVVPYYDNEDNDQSVHAIQPKHFTNGNDGLRKNGSGTQLQATVNGEANPEINITKTSANTPPHNVNGSDGLGGNGCAMDLYNLGLCLGLLEYSSQIVCVKWYFLILNAFLFSFHLLLDLFPFVIVVVGIVIGSQPIVTYQIRSISLSPFVCGVHHPPTNPHLHR
ncbi:MAG: hypothetical protein EZS28_050059, partial [Streblomastix strix]